MPGFHRRRLIRLLCCASLSFQRKGGSEYLHVSLGSLSSIGGCDRLSDARHLAACADDLVAGSVADKGDVLVLPLGALPDLDLAAATQDAHAHG